MQLPLPFLPLFVLKVSGVVLIELIQVFPTLPLLFLG
jgi:hypothetical protein